MQIPKINFSLNSIKNTHFKENNKNTYNLSNPNKYDTVELSFKGNSEILPMYTPDLSKYDDEKTNLMLDIMEKYGDYTYDFIKDRSVESLKSISTVLDSRDFSDILDFSNQYPDYVDKYIEILSSSKLEGSESDKDAKIKKLHSKMEQKAFLDSFKKRNLNEAKIHLANILDLEGFKPEESSKMINYFSDLGNASRIIDFINLDLNIEQKEELLNTPDENSDYFQLIEYVSAKPQVSQAKGKATKEEQEKYVQEYKIFYGLATQNYQITKGYLDTLRETKDETDTKEHYSSDLIAEIISLALYYPGEAYKLIVGGIKNNESPDKISEKIKNYKHFRTGYNNHMGLMLELGMKHPDMRVYEGEKKYFIDGHLEEIFEHLNKDNEDVLDLLFNTLKYTDFMYAGESELYYKDIVNILEASNIDKDLTIKLFLTGEKKDGAIEEVFMPHIINTIVKISAHNKKMAQSTIDFIINKEQHRRQNIDPYIILKNSILIENAISEEQDAKKKEDLEKIAEKAFYFEPYIFSLLLNSYNTTGEDILKLLDSNLTEWEIEEKLSSKNT